MDFSLNEYTIALLALNIAATLGGIVYSVLRKKFNKKSVEKVSELQPTQSSTHRAAALQSTYRSTNILSTPEVSERI